MKAPAALSRVVLPPLFWLALCIVSFIAAMVDWQDQRIDRLRPPPSTVVPAPAPVPPASGAATPGAAAPTQPGPTQAAAAPPAVGLLTTAAPPRDLRVGRQVLRCVTRGRVTYRDLNAGCPEGSTQRLTVFPIEGVGSPQ